MAVNGGEWQANRRQAALIDRLSRVPYVTLAQACREMDIPIDTAGKWHRSPPFRSALDQQRRTESDQLRAELEAQLLAQGEAAIVTKIALLTAQSEQVRHMAPSYILDRILGKPTERTEQTIDAGVTLWEGLARKLHEESRHSQAPPPSLLEHTGVAVSGSVTAARSSGSSLRMKRPTPKRSIATKRGCEFNRRGIDAKRDERRHDDRPLYRLPKSGALYDR